MAMMMMMTIVVVFMASMLMSPVTSEILYGETANMTFEVWAADLKPGFILKEKDIGGRQCYCKKPGWFSSSSSYGSFSFNTIGPLTSTGGPESSFDFIYVTKGKREEEDQVIGELQPTTASGLRNTACGLCDMDVTFDDSYAGQTYDWTSPGWKENKNYPDGCTCTLKVHFRTARSGTFLYAFAPGSAIKAYGNCVFDRMEVNLNGAEDRWCDEMITKTGTIQTSGVNTDFTFTFVSDPNDGNDVHAGFKLTLQAFLSSMDKQYLY